MVAPPVGYGTCRIAVCGAWNSPRTLIRSGGTCLTCHMAGLGEQFRRIEIVSRGRRTMITKTSVKPRKHHPTRRAGPEKRQAAHASRRALKRLKNLFPDLYDILYAEERASVGLEPWPLRRALEHHDDPDGSVAAGFAEMLHASTRSECPVSRRPRDYHFDMGRSETGAPGVVEARSVQSFAAMPLNLSANPDDRAYVRELAGRRFGEISAGWKWYERLGTVRAAVERSAKIAGYTKFVAQRLAPDGTVETEIEDGRIAEAAQMFFARNGGTRGLVERFFVLMKIPAESWLVREEDDDGLLLLVVERTRRERSRLRRRDAGMMKWVTAPSASGRDRCVPQGDLAAELLGAGVGSGPPIFRSGQLGDAVAHHRVRDLVVVDVEHAGTAPEPVRDRRNAVRAVGDQRDRRHIR